MKARLFEIRHILVRPEEMLKLNETSMKILRKSQNQRNISENTLTIHFPEKFYILSEQIITSEKS